METYTVLLGTLPEKMAEKLIAVIEGNLKIWEGTLSVIEYDGKCMVFAKDTISEWECSLIRHVITVMTPAEEESEMKEVASGLGLTVDSDEPFTKAIKDLADRSSLPRKKMTPEELASYKERFDEINEYLDNKE